MSDISPEMVERMMRMIVLVRELAETAPRSTKKDHIWDDARAIADELPVPVDPDLIEARKMVADMVGVNHPQYYLSGACDDWSNVRLALSAIKRGRDLALSQAS